MTDTPYLPGCEPITDPYGQRSYKPAVGHEFDGATYEPKRDKARLKRLLDRVRDYMACEQWHTLLEIQSACGGTETSVSARLRDLRKPKFGGFRVDHEHIGGGVWRYRVVAS